MNSAEQPLINDCGFLQLLGRELATQYRSYFFERLGFLAALYRSIGYPYG